MKNISTATCPNDARIKICRKALTNRHMEDFIHTAELVVDTAHQSSAVPKTACEIETIEKVIRDIDEKKAELLEREKALLAQLEKIA